MELPPTVGPRAKEPELETPRWITSAALITDSKDLRHRESRGREREPPEGFLQSRRERVVQFFRKVAIKLVRNAFAWEIEVIWTALRAR